MLRKYISGVTRLRHDDYDRPAPWSHQRPAGMGRSSGIRRGAAHYARLYTEGRAGDDGTTEESEFSARHGYSYSNTGYILLAIIVEQVSGESLATFSKDQLFEPLGLVRTRWRDDFRAVVKGRAVAYDAELERLPPAHAVRKRHRKRR